MKKPFFDRHLYREALRRLATPGIFCLIALSLIGTVNIGSIIRRYNYAPAEIRAGSYYPREADGAFLAGYLSFLLPVIALYLVFRLWSCLRSRCASDFFDSLPYARKTVFFSRYAAFLTWLAVISAVPVLCSVLLCLANPAVFSLQPGSLFSELWQDLLFTLGISSAALLSCSLTGTVFAGLGTWCTVFFLPPLFLYRLSEILGRSGVALDLSRKGPPDTSGIADRLSIAAGSYLRPWSYRSSTRCFVILTLAVLLICSALAFFFYCRRKSETAENPMGYRGAYIAVRSLIPVLLLWLLDGNIYGWALAVVAGICFEIINTKKWSNVLKSLPWALLSVVIYLLPEILAALIRTLA